MATADSVKNKIRGLIDAANAVTGNTDTDLTTAVESLVAGYGQGDGLDYAVDLLAGTLVEINDPLITNLRSYAFYYNSGIERFIAPNLRTVSANAFRYTTLKYFDSGCSQINASAFANCASLDTIVLRSPTLCTLSSGNAFNYTPFAYDGSGGTLYVPEALLEAYAEATNWSSLFETGVNLLAPIEGSRYE